jgi:hypothetical protein
LFVVVVELVDAGAVVVDVSSFGPQALKITATVANNKTFFIYSFILLLRNAAQPRAPLQAENSLSIIT